MDLSACRRRVSVRRGMPVEVERARMVMCRCSLSSRRTAAAAALRPTPGFVACVPMLRVCHIGPQGDGMVTKFAGGSQHLARCPSGHLMWSTWTPTHRPSSGRSPTRWRPQAPASSSSAETLTSPAPPSSADSEPDAASSSTKSAASPPPSEPPPARSSPRQKPPNPKETPCATPPRSSPSPRQCPS
nr:MAG TPA: hypothetical protein [Caudoviricetes sp.]